MSTSFAWMVVLVSIATYATRLPSLWLGRFIRLTPRLQRGLSFIPIGVFAAMVAPTVWEHGTSAPVDWAFLAGTMGSIAIAVLTRNPLWTMMVGMVVVAAIRWL